MPVTRPQPHFYLFGRHCCLSVQPQPKLLPSVHPFLATVASSVYPFPATVAVLCLFFSLQSPSSGSQPQSLSYVHLFLDTQSLSLVCLFPSCSHISCPPPPPSRTCQSLQSWVMFDRLGPSLSRMTPSALHYRRIFSLLIR